MDLPHRYSGGPEPSLDLVHELIRRGVDFTSSGSVPNPYERRFGHSFRFVIERLMKGIQVPMLPILLNTYFPPNSPTAARCYEVGKKITTVLAASPDPAPLAAVAPGWLSHFLCEEAFDWRNIAALQDKGVGTLIAIPQQAFLSGSSAIRNWVTLAAMVEKLRADFVECLPVYRMLFGTEIGL